MVCFLIVLQLSSCTQNSFQSPTELNTDGQTYEIPPVTGSTIPSTTVFPAESSVDNIPDITMKIDERVANSNYTLYEDDGYIYYLNVNDTGPNFLFYISKEDGKIRKISEKDCSCFTLYNGLVYYTELSGSNTGYWNVIKSFEPKTGIEKLILKLKNNIYSIAVYDNKIYFTYDINNYIEPSSNLYSVSLDGHEMKKIRGDVYTFCIYKRIIYYTESSNTDESPLNKCDLEGNKFEQLTDDTDWYFDVSDNRLFFNKGFIDIYSKQTEEMNYDEFAPLGQYLIYNNYIGKPSDSEKEDCVFTAYILQTGQQYYLTTLTGIDVYNTTGLHSTVNNVYWSMAMGDGSFELFRLIIENGRARLVKIAVYTIKDNN